MNEGTGDARFMFSLYDFITSPLSKCESLHNMYRNEKIVSITNRLEQFFTAVLVYFGHRLCHEIKPCKVHGIQTNKLCPDFTAFVLGHM